MKLSIVTITLNAARDLPITIESVAGQDFRDFEYLVVDGQSWDSTHEVLRRYKKEITRVIEVEDAGVYSAMNFAISQCSGEYILFMNAGDTFYSQHVLSDIFSYLGKEAPDVIHGEHMYVDKGLEFHKRSVDFGITRKALFEGKVSHKWHDRFPCHQATFTKKALLDRLGGYDTRYEICADHEFLLRAYDSGATMKFIDEIVAHYVGGGMSATRGERCGMEWIQVYRARSQYPQKVDELFSADHLVRFDTQSETTGAKVSGFFGLEGPDPDHGMDFRYSWCAGDGFSVVTPRSSESISMTIVGENRLEDQRLTFMSGGQNLADVDVPTGRFKVEATFKRPLPPHSIVQILPSRSIMFDTDGRAVSILCKSFSFELLGASNVDPLPLGREQVFGLRFAQVVGPLLRGGWSSLEPQHLWSVGESSRLALNIPSAAKELRIKMSGNPFLPEDRRKVALSVNGSQIEVGLQLSPAPKVYKFPLRNGGWRSDATNFLTLMPLETAEPPSDPRQLGVCLHSVEIC